MSTGTKESDVELALDVSRSRAEGRSQLPTPPGWSSVAAKQTRDLPIDLDYAAPILLPQILFLYVQEPGILPYNRASSTV